MSDLSAAHKSKRILSVDALRGFDMFWIMGAEGIFAACFVITGWSGFNTLAKQMQHTVWHGFTAYDLIFPLFIFLSGVTIGLTAKSIHSYPQHVRKSHYQQAFKRLALLILLGVVYNHAWGAGMPTDIDEVRFASVLGRIGVAWFLAIMLVWHCSEKQQWFISALVLFSYWLLLSFFTVGEYGGGNLSMALSLNTWVDQHFLPGASYQNLPLDPEGILSNLPSVINAMIGVFIGRKMKTLNHLPKVLVGQLFLAGSLMLMAGYLWGFIFPLNKSLWTSSFVLVTCGYSTLLLMLFYLVIDVCGWKKLAKFFAVVGMNSIVVYLGTSLFNWHYTAHSLAGGLIKSLPNGWATLSEISIILLCQWLLLFWLYRQKIFIKV